MSVNTAKLPGKGFQDVTTTSGLASATVSKVTLYKTGSTLVIAITPSSGNPCYVLEKSGQVKINSSGVGADEWDSAGGVLVTPQHV